MVGGAEGYFMSEKKQKVEELKKIRQVRHKAQGIREKKKEGKKVSSHKIKGRW